MEHVVKNSTLGSLLNETIKELKIEREEIKLNKILKECFEENY